MNLVVKKSRVKVLHWGEGAMNGGVQEVQGVIYYYL